MPAVRSFFTVSVLAACLAQVMAGGQGGDGGQGGWGGEGQGQDGGPPHVGGGDRGGKDYQTTQWQGWQPQPTYTQPPAPVCEPTTITKEVEKLVTVTYTKEGEKVTVTSIKDGGKATITEVKTVTVTAAAPCTSVATAVVTQWQNAPPGCFCGGGSPPGWPASGQWPWPAGDAALFTTVIPNFVPGRSSIPAAEAVKTGVTVAGPAPAPTGAPVPPAGGPPGAGFASTSSAK